jgi:hypothetical protein
LRQTAAKSSRSAAAATAKDAADFSIFARKRNLQRRSWTAQVPFLFRAAVHTVDTAERGNFEGGASTIIPTGGVSCTNNCANQRTGDRASCHF